MRSSRTAAPSENNSDDPLNIFMRPPRNESAEHKARRIEHEKWQRRANAEIDEQLRVEKASMNQKLIRVLLVGEYRYRSWSWSSSNDVSRSK